MNLHGVPVASCLKGNPSRPRIRDIFRAIRDLATHESGPVDLQDAQEMWDDASAIRERAQRALEIQAKLRDSSGGYPEDLIWVLFLLTFSAKKT